MIEVVKKGAEKYPVLHSLANKLVIPSVPALWRTISGMLQKSSGRTHIKSCPIFPSSVKDRLGWTVESPEDAFQAVGDVYDNRQSSQDWFIAWIIPPDDEQIKAAADSLRLALLHCSARKIRAAFHEGLHNGQPVEALVIRRELEGFDPPVRLLAGEFWGSRKWGELREEFAQAWKLSETSQVTLLLEAERYLNSRERILKRAITFMTYIPWILTGK